MMASKIITLAKVKELMGIGDTTYDTQITRYIPIIDAKVKKLTRNRYNKQIYGKTTAGSKYVEVFSIDGNATSGINNKYTLDDLVDYLEVGAQISGDGIAADTYIDDVFYNGASVTFSSTDYGVPVIELSANATATDDNAQLFLGLNIGLQTTVAKGIMWLITQETITAPESGVSSKSIGSVSISYTTDSAKLDGKTGMPGWFVSAFPRYMGGH